jgi:hypothetical protein
MPADRNELERLADELYTSAGGDARRLAIVAAQYQQATRARTGGALEVLGIVSVRTGKPVVTLGWGESAGQLSPEQARAHALLVLEAAQNAVTDAAILAWARTELDLDLETAGRLLDGLRTFRADKWGQPDLELELGRPAPPEPDDGEPT